MNAQLEVVDLYLDLLKKTLTRMVAPERYRPLRPRFPLKRALVRSVNALFGAAGLELVSRYSFDVASRSGGLDWPPEAETMIGLQRLDHLQRCIADLIEDDVPGDLIETGVWRGGASIFMRACLKAFGDERRTVWLADSFAGLPAPDATKYPADAGDTHSTFSNVLAVSADEVRRNFTTYGLLDDRVRFLQGWFEDTLPNAPIEAIALLRLDGDMYGSTMQALEALYPRLSPGGYCIVDDYSLPGCRAAIHDYRGAHDVTEPIVPIDLVAVAWRRMRPQ